MTIETEANPTRVAIVKKVIEAHADEPRTVEALSKYFEEYSDENYSFDFGADDIERYEMAETPIEFTPDESEAKPETVLERARRIGVDGVAPIKAEDAEPPVATPEEIDAALDRKIAADHDLANARSALMGAQSVEKDARAKLAKAVTQFQIGLAPMTPEQLRREWIESQQEERRQRAAQGWPEPEHGRPGKSAIDRYRFNAGRGSVNTRGGHRERLVEYPIGSGQYFAPQSAKNRSMRPLSQPAPLPDTSGARRMIAPKLPSER
jgi:hypothetical protein